MNRSVASALKVSAVGAFLWAIAFSPSPAVVPTLRPLSSEAMASVVTVDDSDEGTNFRASRGKRKKIWRLKLLGRVDDDDRLRPSRSDRPTGSGVKGESHDTGDGRDDGGDGDHDND